jgi:hypothetical protein
MSLFRKLWSDSGPTIYSGSLEKRSRVFLIAVWLTDVHIANHPLSGGLGMIDGWSSRFFLPSLPGSGTTPSAIRSQAVIPGVMFRIFSTSPGPSQKFRNVLNAPER